MHVCVCVYLRVFNGLCTLQHGKILSSPVAHLHK